MNVVSIEGCDYTVTLGPCTITLGTLPCPHCHQPVVVQVTYPAREVGT